MKRNHYHNIQDFWDMVKLPNLWICGVEKGTKKQTKEIEKLFSEITAETSPPQT
jgi:hypothetical protein